MNFRELRARILKLPYRSQDTGFYIVLPNKPEDLQHVERNINDVALQAAENSLRTRRVSLKLPKFKMEQTLNVKTILEDVSTETASYQKTRVRNKRASEAMQILSTNIKKNNTLSKAVLLSLENFELLSKT